MFSPAVASREKFIPCFFVIESVYSLIKATKSSASLQLSSSSQYFFPVINWIASLRPIKPIARVPCFKVSLTPTLFISSYHSLYSWFVGNKEGSAASVFSQRSISTVVTFSAIKRQLSLKLLIFSSRVSGFLALTSSLLQWNPLPFIASNASRGRLTDTFAILPRPIEPWQPWISSTTRERQPITESFNGSQFLSSSQSHKR